MSALHCCRAIVAALAVVALALGIFCDVAVAQSDTPEQPKPFYNGTPLDPELDPPDIDMPPTWDSSKREKMVAQFERKIGRMKPYGKNKKKDLDDYFLIATGDINTVAKSADVRFLVLKSQRTAAEFLVDYVAAAPEGVVRQWHVFARFKEPADAQAGLATVRQQYDRMVAYRKKMQELYRVASTRRC